MNEKSLCHIDGYWEVLIPAPNLLKWHWPIGIQQGAANTKAQTSDCWHFCYLTLPHSAGRHGCGWKKRSCMGSVQPWHCVTVAGEGACWPCTIPWAVHSNYIAFLYGSFQCSVSGILLFLLCPFWREQRYIANTRWNRMSSLAPQPASDPCLLPVLQQIQLSC